MRTKKAIVFLLGLCYLCGLNAEAQTCTALGQNPSTAFPVCGTTTFVQDDVPICSSNDLFVPGCQDGALYANKNPFWYKFTCYTSGTLGFTITPKNLDDDYDWQLYDVTGLPPDAVYTNRDIIVAANWSGSSGVTGASASGVNGIQCASDPAQNTPTFAKMPTLIAGHEYILLVSHYTNSQSGYSLSFAGGSAVITDPAIPHLLKASPDCDGRVLTVKLNKKMRCNTLTPNGSEFSISPAVATVVSAVALNCTTGFDFDSVRITLSAPLTSGGYQLIINNGSDVNTLLDNCGHSIALAEQIPFQFNLPQPIFADSIGRVGCAPNQLKLYFPKKIDCSTIAANGTDFSITGPTAVTVSSATGDCVNGQSNVITINLAAPIYTMGNYQLNLRAGTDGSTVVDECGLESPTQSIGFTTTDTVNAAFSYINEMGCRQDTLHFFHNGNNQVNSWNWTFNNTKAITQNHTVRWPASSTNSVQLIVSNGICSDTIAATIVLNNEVKAAFDMPAVICPEDALTVVNNSNGLIDIWRWQFGTISTSNLEDPAPVLFPGINREIVYPIKLVTTNTALGCSDSIQKNLRVLNNCYIAVPTAFTPNGDGLNDFLYPNNAIKAENLDFRVFNRWGQTVFQTNDWTKKWNGKIGGVEQGSGVYVWFLSYTHKDTGQKMFQKGTTTLIR